MKTFAFFTLFVSSLAFAAPENKDHAEMMKLMAPNEMHQKLAEMKGNWNYTMTMWMAPDAKPETSKGSSKAKTILGGRFLQEDVKAKMNGMTFEGINLVGYDTMKKAYQSVWIDNMSTSMMLGEGVMDNGVLKTEGTFACPMTGEKNRKYRSEMAVTDKDHHTFAMYANGPDGKEFKMMEIAYTRAK